MDAIADGIIFCSSAGNNGQYADTPGSALYDSAVIFENGDSRYYMRGQSPGSAPGVICVGAVDATVVERKPSYSNKGPRVDIYAPAVNTIAARNTLYNTPTTVIDGTTTTTTLPPSPPFYFVSLPTTVNEGTDVTVQIGRYAYASYDWLYWTIRFDNSRPNEADYEDFDGTRLEAGVVDFDYETNIGSFTFRIVADMYTEGTETFDLEFSYLTSSGTGPLTRSVIMRSPPINIIDTSTGNMLPPGIDVRNTNYYKGIFGGTSSASPHVAGIIACALETYPNMTPAQALSYIQTYANHGVLADSPVDTNYTANQWFLYEKNFTLFNGPNKYATYQPNTRPNWVYPAIGTQSRPTTGAVYPRTLIKRNQ
jgi:hypothetical protein